MAQRKQAHPRTLVADARGVVQVCAGLNIRLAARRITRFLDAQMQATDLSVAQFGLMAHIAAAFPDLSLGTSVLVLPWYHPLRLAEEIAMLNGMTTGTLHLGIGRGTAKMEYDAYNVDMNEGRARFAEVLQIVEKGLSGATFTHRGRFWTFERPIRMRPGPVVRRATTGSSEAPRGFPR